MTPKKISNYGDSKIKKQDIINAFLENPHDWQLNKAECDRRGTQIVLRYLGFEMHPQHKNEIKHLVSILRLDFQKKYAKYNGHRKMFFKKNSDWLQTSFRLPTKYILHRPATPKNEVSVNRKTKRFENLASSSKRWKLSKLSKQQEDQTEKEILLTASKTVKLRNGKSNELSSLLEKVASPSKVTHVLQKLKQPDLIPFTPNEALNLFVEKRMTYDLYTTLKTQNKSRGADIYPSYRLLSKAREECIPSMDSMKIDEYSAVVSTESLLIHTAKRLVLLQEEVIGSVIEKRKGILRLKLICSWGVDGSSGHSVYKQKAVEKNNPDEEKDIDESCLFITTMTPLRLIGLVGKNDNEIVLWNNILPQSFRSCRPMKIQYRKESKDLILEEISRVQSEIDALSSLNITLQNGRIVTVSFLMQLTVIDGKVLSAIQNVPSMCCPLCHSKPTDFNKKENVGTSRFEPTPSSLTHGASCLHARIRFMECLLHVAYRLEVKVWRVTDPGDKLKVQAKKREIQDLFKSRLKLRVDYPNSGGAGTSNDGNTSRKFFENYSITAEILGIEEELVLRFYYILLTINCQQELKAADFGAYCIETNNMFIDLYGWFKIPSSVHKILVHSEAIILSSILPLGVLSEEGAESRHKYFKDCKLFHARKNSKLNAIMDIFLGGFYTSDPVISSFSVRSRKNLGNRDPFPSKVLSFLKEPDVYSTVTPQSSQESTHSRNSNPITESAPKDDLEAVIEKLVDTFELECEDFDLNTVLIL